MSTTNGDTGSALGQVSPPSPVTRFAMLAARGRQDERELGFDRASPPPGAGCEVVLLDQGDLQARLTYAIEEAWQSAETLRPRLLAAARQQAEQGRDAYRKLFEILTNMRTKCMLRKS